MSASYNESWDDCVSAGYEDTQCGNFSRCVSAQSGLLTGPSVCHPDNSGDMVCTAMFPPLGVAEAYCFNEYGRPLPPEDIPVPPEEPPFDWTCHCPAHHNFNPLQIFVANHSRQISMASLVLVAALIVFIGITGQ